MNIRSFLPSLLLASALTGCGISRTDARDRATQAWCARFQECEGFGDGRTYTSRDDCEVRQRDFWHSAWPADRCEDSINSEAFDTCLRAISITDCRNGFDVLNTLGKCSAGEVCARPASN